MFDETSFCRLAAFVCQYQCQQLDERTGWELRRDFRTVYVPSDIRRRWFGQLAEVFKLFVASVVCAGYVFAHRATIVPASRSFFANSAQRRRTHRCDIDKSTPRCRDILELDPRPLSVHKQIVQKADADTLPLYIRVFTSITLQKHIYAYRRRRQHRHATHCAARNTLYHTSLRVVPHALVDKLLGGRRVPDFEVPSLSNKAAIFIGSVSTLCNVRFRRIHR